MRINGMKKIVVAVATVFLITGLISACGKANNSGNAVDPSDTNTGSPSPEASQAPELKPVTLKMFLPGSPQKDHEAVMAEVNSYLTDKINAKLELNFLDWGPWFEKMPVMQASREEYDLQLTALWSGFLDQVSKGAFLPLDELSEQYAPDAKGLFRPEALGGARFKGQLYGMPTIKELALAKGIVLRKDLVDKYQIDVSQIKSAADLEPALETIKKNEPGIWPYYIMNANGPWALVAGELDMAQDKWVDFTTTPKAKETIELARGWFEKGYINDNAPTAKDFDQQVKAGKVFAFENASIKPGSDKELQTKYNYEFVIAQTSEAVISNSSVGGAMLSISSTSNNPERAMMFINLLYTDKKLGDLLSFGLENTHYTKAGDNVIKGVENSGWLPGIDWMLGNQLDNYTWEHEDPDKFKNYEEWNKTAAVSPDLGFNFDPTPVKNEQGALKNIDDQFKTALVTGSIDPSKLDEYLKRRKEAGAEKVFAEMNRQYEEFKASTKQ